MQLFSMSFNFFCVHPFFSVCCCLFSISSVRIHRVWKWSITKVAVSDFFYFFLYSSWSQAVIAEGRPEPKNCPHLVAGIIKVVFDLKESILSLTFFQSVVSLSGPLRIFCHMFNCFTNRKLRTAPIIITVLWILFFKRMVDRNISVCEGIEEMVGRQLKWANESCKILFKTFS
jgi:hypothetical protein